jgi:hypothetical protein
VYVDPLIVRMTVNRDAAGTIYLERVEAFGALGSIGPFPGQTSSMIEVFIESPGGPDWLTFHRPERPLTPADTKVLTKVGDPNILGTAIASHAAYLIRRRSTLSQADTRAVQRRAGSRRARATDEDLLLVAEAVRTREPEESAAAAVMKMPGRQIGRSYAYQLIKRAKAEGYLSESEARS